jgi:hypothetical protein
VLAQPDQAYAIYLAPAGKRSAAGETVVSLELAVGSYRAEWVDPLTGKTVKRQTVTSKKGLVVLTSPSYGEDIALRVTRK